MTEKQCENCKFYDEDIDTKPCCSCKNKENFEAETDVDSKMEEKDIIKALECCGKPYCNDNKCPLYKNTVNTKDCITQLSTNTLELIKNQQAEIEKVQTQKEISNSELAKAINKSLEQAKEIGDLKTEIEKLKNSCSCLAIERDAYKDVMSEAIAEAKEEAYKEFAELAIKRICEQVSAPIPSESYIVEKCNQTIDSISKELTERKEN